MGDESYDTPTGPFSSDTAASPEPSPEPSPAPTPDPYPQAERDFGASNLYGTAGAGAETPVSGGGVAAPAQAQKQPGAWQRILTGALVGMAGGAGAKNFGQGMAGGAKASLEHAQMIKENAMKQEQIDTHKSEVQANIKWRDAEQAFRTTQLAHQDKMLELQTAEARDKHDAAQANMVKFNQENFGVSYQAFPNTAENVTKYLEQGTSNAQAAGQPGVSIPSGVILTSGTIYVPTGANTIDQQFSQANSLAKALGVPAPPEQAFRMSGTQGRAKTIERLEYQMRGLDPNTGTFYTPDKLPMAISALQHNIAAYGKDPSHSDATMKIMGESLGSMQAQAKGINTQAAAKITAEIPAEANKAAAVTKATIETKQKYDNSPVYAMDSKGDTVLTTQSAATGLGYGSVRKVKQGDISKDQHDIKVLNDIQVKSNQVATAATAMDGNSWGQVGRVAKYLSDNPNTTANSLLNSQMMNGMTPQARAYTINILSLRESAMGLQKVLTGTARTNETQLQALLATLPGVEPNSGVVSQKLQAFDQNLYMLSQGLPKGTGVESVVKAPSQQSVPNGHQVGDIIMQGTQRFKATQVDRNGKVIAAEPMQ